MSGKTKKVAKPKALIAKKPKFVEVKAPPAPKPKKVKVPPKPKLCGGSMPYATKGHAMADAGCCSKACEFCCNKYGTRDFCDVHKDADDDDS